MCACAICRFLEVGLLIPAGIHPQVRVFFRKGDKNRWRHKNDPVGKEKCLCQFN